MDFIPEIGHLFHEKCYLTNNRYAYKFDRDQIFPVDELKTDNFVPTYDKWCLNCDKKGCKYRCVNCKSVYFCGEECQIKSYGIHKKHCERDLFILCASCGCSEPKMKCDNCPVKWCSEICKNKMYSPHVEYKDCEFFHDVFGKLKKYS